jgi:hypothetical protein
VHEKSSIRFGCVRFSPVAPVLSSAFWYYRSGNIDADRPTTSHVMKLLPYILLFVLVGCGPSELQTRKLSEQISQLVPDGTPLASARQIMEQHQFTCSVVSYEKQSQTTNSADAILWTTFVVRDGLRQAVTNITHLECKASRRRVTITVVNGTTHGFSVSGSPL